MPRPRYARTLVNDSPFAELFAEFPKLKTLGLQYRDSTVTGKDWRGEPYEGRKMEYYPPDEGHNPNPGKPTIEVFDKKTNSKDMLGEVFSHLLPATDPEFRKARADFISGLDKNQREILTGDYEAFVKSGVSEKGREPTFEQWLSTVGGDAFFRGYVANQYPKKFYRKDQIELFDNLLKKLK